MGPNFQIKLNYRILAEKLCFALFHPTASRHKGNSPFWQGSYEMRRQLSKKNFLLLASYVTGTKCTALAGICPLKLALLIKKIKTNSSCELLQEDTGSVLLLWDIFPHGWVKKENFLNQNIENERNPQYKSNYWMIWGNITSLCAANPFGWLLGDNAVVPKGFQTFCNVSQP